MLDEIFGTSKPIIGVIHLLPLPGSARFDGNLDAVLARAEQEAAALASGGANAIIVENFFDAPFRKNHVDTACACAMTLAAQKIKAISGLPLGINVLRNDGHTALAIARACGAQFVRVNVWVGAMVTDQGVIEGEAHDLLNYRKVLGCDGTVKIMADVMVKHAVPLGFGNNIGQIAKDTIYRGLADAVIVSGGATGQEAAIEDLQAVRDALPDTPLFVGSGTTRANVSKMLSVADGVIVATSIKRQGKLENPVDVDRLRDLVAAATNQGVTQAQ